MISKNETQVAAGRPREKGGKPPYTRPGGKLKRPQPDGDRQGRILALTAPVPGPTWTPWLVIRNSLADKGARPLARPEQFCWWTSPDIWVESSDPAGAIVSNEDNYVCARIFNLGAADAMPVRVDFYWASPAPLLTGSDAHLIGTEWVTVRALTSREVRCGKPLRPVSDQPIFARTIIVQCSDPILDPIQHPFQPILDRHVGPYSMAMIPASSGRPVTLALDIQNPFPLHASTSLVLRIEQLAPSSAPSDGLESRLFVPGIIEPEVVALRDDPMAAGAASPSNRRLAPRNDRPSQRGSHFVRKVPGMGAAPRVSAQLSPRVTYGTPALSSGGFSTMAKAMEALQAAPRSHSAGDDLVVERATLGPFEHRDLELELDVPESSRPGDLVLVHVQQRVEDTVLGGYSVVVRVTS